MTEQKKLKKSIKILSKAYQEALFSYADAVKQQNIWLESISRLKEWVNRR